MPARRTQKARHRRRRLGQLEGGDTHRFAALGIKGLKLPRELIETSGRHSQPIFAQRDLAALHDNDRCLLRIGCAGQ